MTACIWAQVEPLGSTTPYVGFINATVTGDSASPPTLTNNRVALQLPLGTSIAGMQFDMTKATPVLIPILPQNIVPPVAPPSVTGSIAGGAALTSLLQVLATAGVITNNTTA